MRHVLAAAVAAIFSASAAQAAVYQYDVKMKLTELTLDSLWAVVDGTPHPQFENTKCESWDYDGSQLCEGSINFNKGRRGLDFLRDYTQVISGTFTLDSEWGLTRDALAPKCSGSTVLCRAVGWAGRPGDIGYSASSEGFYLQPTSIWFNWHVDDDGLSYFADAANSYDFTLGNTTYYSGSSNDLIAEYQTTSLKITEISDYPITSLKITEIAPVPLPASLPLLGIGIAAIGFAKRRKASRSA